VRSPAEGGAHAGRQGGATVDDDEQGASGPQTAREELAEEQHVQAPPGDARFPSHLEAIAFDVDDVSENPGDRRLPLGRLEDQPGDRIVLKSRRRASGFREDTVGSEQVHDARCWHARSALAASEFA
jgi:hypothetical protein